MAYIFGEGQFVFLKVDVAKGRVRFISYITQTQKPRYNVLAKGGGHFHFEIHLVFLYALFFRLIKPHSFGIKVVGISIYFKITLFTLYVDFDVKCTS